MKPTIQTLSREVFLRSVLDWLEEKSIHGILVDELKAPNPIVELPEHKLAIHMVSLNDRTNVPDEFIRLSEDFAAEHYTLVHLWEDVWVTKKPIVMSRLESLLKINKRIHARETKVSRIDKVEAHHFLEENHLIGNATGKYKYGLYKRGELASIATFGSVLKVKREGEPFRSYEMIRYCNKCGYTVVGGLSKLIKAFSREHDPDDIVTYTDRDWSRGHGFRRLRFELLDTTPVQYFYVHPETFERNWLHRPPFKIPENSTKENIKWEYLQRGYYEVFNTGNWKFIRYYK